MDKFVGTATILLLFVLRCIMPMALTLLISWAMDRIADKWEAEEAVRNAKPEPILPKSKSVLPVQPDMTQLVRCWVFRDCGRTDCVAYQNPDRLCWQIKIAENGRLPATCQQCAYYQKIMAMVQ